MEAILEFLFGGWAEQLFFGSCVTVGLALISYSLGILVALFFTICRLFNISFINYICSIYTSTFRCIPELLLIFFFFYSFSSLNKEICSMFNIYISSIFIGFIAAAVALGLITGTYVTEIFRGGISSLNKGEIEAAEALAMPKFIMLYRIIIPQLISNTWKPLSNVWLVALKDTALVAIVGVSELMFKANLGVATENTPFIFYIYAALLYLCMMLVSRFVFNNLSYKYNYLVKINR